MSDTKHTPADRALFEAAPDLLEALENAALAMESEGFCPDPHCPDCDHILPHAWAAIAKAKGEDQQ